MSVDDSFWLRALGWAWDNWDAVRDRLARLRNWWGRGPASPDPAPGILLIGPGGVGKSTLARLMSGRDTPGLAESPWVYQESISEERYTLSDDPAVEVVVPPGQPSRREAGWADVCSDLATGKYRGVVLVAAFGYHSFASTTSYRHHELYANNKDRFLAAYLGRQRDDERGVLDHLRPGLESAPGKVWLLIVVAKQDLWWPDRKAAAEHYGGEAWAAGMAAVQAARGVKAFRHETVSACQVISNFVTGQAEVLRQNAAGYDHKMQVESLRRLFEVIDGLRDWEEQP